MKFSRLLVLETDYFPASYAGRRELSGGQPLTSSLSAPSRTPGHYRIDPPVSMPWLDPRHKGLHRRGHVKIGIEHQLRGLPPPSGPDHEKMSGKGQSVPRDEFQRFPDKILTCRSFQRFVEVQIHDTAGYPSPAPSSRSGFPHAPTSVSSRRRPSRCRSPSLAKL